MKIKIDIKSILGEVLFSFEKENNTIKDTLEEANLRGANLRGAYLGDANLRGAYLRGAYLRGAYLRNANLRGAYLRNANLRGANLEDANLGGANLRSAYLGDAYLGGADLEEANLRDANLGSAYLRDANLRGAYLRGANLRSAYLEDANLRGANLRSAYLRDANLRGADYSEYTSFLLLQCPIEGSFIGWKKCDGYIVKLKICEDAERSSSTSLKCRCSKAEVLEIQNLDGSVADITEICSNYDENFIYKVGETIEVKDFDKCRWNECSTGIHFFIDRNMAVIYR
jgi:uncharacterized protein YjbI with pentapeptide repeats